MMVERFWLFRQSITIGPMAITRLSAAAVSHVVQPRFDPPETKNFSTVTLLAGAELRHRIHRAHGRFRHGEMQRPGFIAGLEKLHPREGDDLVFIAQLAFLGE